MAYLVRDGEIVGTIQGTAELPADFEPIESEHNLPIEMLYYEAGEIKLKPDRPGENFVWLDKQWQAIAATPQIPMGPDWVGLLTGLHHSQPWARVYEAAGRTLKANRAFTLLLDTLSTSKNLGTLQFALHDMRDALVGINTIGDFPESEIATLNELLAQHNFELQIE